MNDFNGGKMLIMLYFWKRSGFCRPGAVWPDKAIFNCFGDNFHMKVAKVLVILGLLLKCNFWSENYLGLFLANFRKNCATFCCIIWSHFRTMFMRRVTTKLRHSDGRKLITWHTTSNHDAWFQKLKKVFSDVWNLPKSA